MVFTKLSDNNLNIQVSHNHSFLIFPILYKTIKNMEVTDLMKKKLLIALEFAYSERYAEELNGLILNDNATLEDLYDVLSRLKKDDAKHKVMNVNLHSLIDHLVVVGDKETQDQLVEKLTQRTKELLADINQEFYSC